MLYRLFGQSLDRFRQYFSLAYLQRDEKSSIICRALLNYGYSNFKLEILEYCEPEECVAREQHYLDTLEHEYNILSTAGSSLGSQHTEETKIKIGEAIRRA
jgi:group I intron endonuclease